MRFSKIYLRLYTLFCFSWFYIFPVCRWYKRNCFKSRGIIATKIVSGYWCSFSNSPRNNFCSLALISDYPCDMNGIAFVKIFLISIRVWHVPGSDTENVYKKKKIIFEKSKKKSSEDMPGKRLIRSNLGGCSIVRCVNRRTPQTWGYYPALMTPVD